MDSVKQRTLQQNKSLHLWLDMLASALNDAGYHQNDRKLIVLDVPFTKENLKENVVRPYMRALYPDYESTTELSTTELQDLYQALDQVIAERTGVHVEYPSLESLSEEQRGD
jgi:hypothetical protein